jgi:phosphoglycolate phosphatase
MEIANIDTIIWDWNGTIMNDLEIAIDAINVVLNRHNLPSVTKEKYLDIFRFPVVDYYRDLGFNFSKVPFETIGKEFMNEYESLWKKTALQVGIESCFQNFRMRNHVQYVLSAASQDSLSRWISHFKVGHFFSDAAGLNNIYAAGKIEIGKELVQRKNINPKRTLLIGDTSHDAEVASALGCHCILLSHGHETHFRLRKTGFPVAKDSAELLTLVGNN